MALSQRSLEQRRHARSRLLAVEVIVAYALIQITLWTERPQQFVWLGIAAAWIVLGILLRRDGPRKLGLGPGSARGWRTTLVIGASASALIVLIGLAAHTVHPLFGVMAPALHTAAYGIWALQQEFILESFFYLALEELLGDARRAVWLTAALFASVHIPSPVLIVATFAGGLFFCEMFRRYRTLWPLAIAHALLGVALAVSVPDSVLHHMRVGLGYWLYRK